MDWTTIYRGNLEWLSARTILLTRHGSHAYGTALPTSDVDVKGVAIPPAPYFHGFLQRFEQAEGKDPDLVIYGLRKFMSLASDCNPNIIEVLWTDASDHLQVTAAGEALIAARASFLSRKAKHTFSGYAAAQLKRIRTHHRWLLNPPAAPPVRADFGLPESSVISPDDRMAAEAAVQKQIEAWGVDLEPLSRPARIDLEGKIAAALAEMKIGADEQWNAAARVLGFSENFIEAMKNERRYRTAQREWAQFQEWKASRNAARAELEARFGYDCYLDDTEFLTESGWCRYDEIPDTARLATLNQLTGALELQCPTERIAKRYSGPMVFAESRDTACAVTPNHRMWTSPVRRQRSNGYSTEFDQDRAEWAIRRAGQLGADRHVRHHVRVATAGGDGTAGVTRDYLALLGAYVSEGCVGKRAGGKPSVLRFSQKAGGRLEKYLDGVGERVPLRKFRSPRKNRRTPCVECVWTMANRELAARIAADCGEGSESKRLPPWTLRLARDDARFLLEVMIAGDGTERKRSRVYYTSSKRLADGVQALAVVAGMVSQVWGPYRDRRRPDGVMFQVYLADREVSTMVCRGPDSHVAVEDVRDVRIVCFTVPNEILITRRNGKVAVQGNTKHGMHLVRLMRMCREILETGRVIVKRPDAAELLAIRHGAWSYDRLVEWAEREDADLEAVAKRSPLPHGPDRVALDALCVRLVEEAL